MLLAFESLRSLRHHDKTAAARARAASVGCELRLFPGLPKAMPWQFALNRLWMSWVIRYVAWKTGARVVHAQSHVAAAAVATALAGRPNCRMVFDVHGVDIEERIADGRLESEFERRQRGDAQANAASRADDLIAVSTALAEHIRSAALAAGREVRGRTHLVPCVLSLEPSVADLGDARREARARLGIGKEPCVLYLGSASNWQQPRLTVDVFLAIQSQIPSARLLIITGEPAVFAELVREAGVPPDRCTITSVAHHDVPRVASAADVSLLLREDTVVNRVSSPTKFAEYLSLGIPVVITEVLSDFADIVRRSDVGAVVRSDAAPAVIAATVVDILTAEEPAAEARRRRCVEAVRRHVSFESILPTYSRIYGSTSTPPSPSP